MKAYRNQSQIDLCHSFLQPHNIEIRTVRRQRTPSQNDSQSRSVSPIRFNDTYRSQVLIGQEQPFKACPVVDQQREQFNSYRSEANNFNFSQKREFQRAHSADFCLRDNKVHQ